LRGETKSDESVVRVEREGLRTIDPDQGGQPLETAGEFRRLVGKLTGLTGLTRAVAKDLIIPNKGTRGHARQCRRQLHHPLGCQGLVRGQQCAQQQLLFVRRVCRTETQPRCRILLTWWRWSSIAPSRCGGQFGGSRSHARSLREEGGSTTARHRLRRLDWGHLVSRRGCLCFWFFGFGG